MSLRRVYVLIAILVSGCSSSFYTARIDTKKWEVTGEKLEGVVYYEPHQVLITYSYSALVDKGIHLGTADEGKCVPIIQKQELAIEPNFSDPKVLLNKTSPFAAGKLSATFSNGMLASINSESAPTAPEMIKEIAGMANALGIASLNPLGQKAACNAAPIISDRKSLN